MDKCFNDLKEFTKNYLQYGEYDTEYIKDQLEKLDKCESLVQILYVIGKGDTLNYLNVIHKEKYLPEQDIADALFNRWVMLEKFHNMGMSKTKILKLMKMADKSNGYGMPKQVPKVITVYRGVDIDDYKGLSWSRNEAVAEWFAKRHLKAGQCGYIFSGELAREDIIAQFSGRKESEVVCNWKKVQNIQCKKVLKTGDEIYKFRK